MKVRFKKIELLVHHRDKSTIATMLQDLGVIHLELNRDFRSQPVEDLELRKTRLSKAIELIEEHVDKKQEYLKVTASESGAIDLVIDETLVLKRQLELNHKQQGVLNKDKQKRSPWGDFDENTLERLTESGVSVDFYIGEKRDFKKYDFGSLVHQVIHEGAGRIYFVLISKGGNVSLPFERVHLPPMRISDIQSEEAKLEGEKNELIKDICSYIPYLPLLREEALHLENQLQLQLANGSYKTYGKTSILHLEGWYPANMEDRLLHFLQKEELSYGVSEPSAGDVIPVLLNNPKYPKLFEPITRIFQLPDYYEMDLTPFIAVFYPILFAYCLGDAGYGLILFTIALIGVFTFLSKSRNLAFLGMILGAFTTVMGVVKSGSLFGIPIIADQAHPIFEFLAQYVMIPEDREVFFNAFNVALLIGVVQILVGIMVSIINKIVYQSILASLSQIGKLLMVVSLIWIFLADMQGVDLFLPYDRARKLMLAMGVLMVLLFHDLKKPVLTRAASAILPLFFIITGILGDILSYVRLFALGVASSVLALVVNQIGMQIMGDQWWSVLIGVIFLLLGHSLNFALAALGAFVHPLRLTFVEFYNNAQFGGGGMPYKPFRKIDVSHSK
ncbi:MAG: V-type ATPase 116kDa subunit family protein [Marinoscillum sp.]|uniref:V-type ATP synthase subunit I n=1 Tax=Marinoscillum sp. TaxID=2024838 RepID=UPI0032F9B90D